MNIAKSYRGYQIERQSGNGFFLWFVAKRNGVKVEGSGAQSIREVELKIDRALADAESLAQRGSCSALNASTVTGSCGSEDVR